MRYFSPNSIAYPTFRHIESCLSKKVSPVTVQGLLRNYEIVPVLVLDVKKNVFHCHFMSNPYYRIDLDVLDGSMFRYVYNRVGAIERGSSGARIGQYTARCYEHIRYDIYMPTILEAGDVLLCSRMDYRNLVGEAEPVLV